MDHRLVHLPARRRQTVPRASKPTWRQRGGQPRRRPATGSASRARVIKGGSFLCADSYCTRYRPAARRRLPQMIDTGMSHISLPTWFAQPSARNMWGGKFGSACKTPRRGLPRPARTSVGCTPRSQAVPTDEGFSSHLGIGRDVARRRASSRRAFTAESRSRRLTPTGPPHDHLSKPRLRSGADREEPCMCCCTSAFAFFPPSPSSSSLS
jgi:hypothetical protein